jgi:putative ABC transport system ATP-binding protein
MPARATICACQDFRFTPEIGVMCPMGSTNSVLEIRNLRYGYQDGSAVLDIPQFTLAKGEMLFLHGPSGSGKTTLLSLVTGVLPLQSGDISILGQSVAGMTAARRDALRAARMGYIFQVFNLLPFLSVLENILLPLHMSPEKSSRVGTLQQAKKGAEQLSERLGIGHLLQRRADELSVGQQQRVAAARALIGSPELIVADEPTSALDSELRGAFITTLFEQARSQNSSVLFVSHDSSLMSYFDRTVALSEINKLMKGKGV